MDNTSRWPEDWFDQFWQLYPRKVAKREAFKALNRERMSGEVEFDRLIKAVKEFAAEARRDTRFPQFCPYPASWINAGRWDDEPEVKQEWTAADRWAQTVNRMKQFQ